MPKIESNFRRYYELKKKRLIEAGFNDEEARLMVDWDRCSLVAKLYASEPSANRLAESLGVTPRRVRQYLERWKHLRDHQPDFPSDPLLGLSFQERTKLELVLPSVVPEVAVEAVDLRRRVRSEYRAGKSRLQLSKLYGISKTEIRELLK